MLTELLSNIAQARQTEISMAALVTDSTSVAIYVLDG